MFLDEMALIKAVFMQTSRPDWLTVSSCSLHLYPSTPHCFPSLPCEHSSPTTTESWSKFGPWSQHVMAERVSPCISYTVYLWLQRPNETKGLIKDLVPSRLQLFSSASSKNSSPESFFYQSGGREVLYKRLVSPQQGDRSRWMQMETS